MDTIYNFFVAHPVLAVGLWTGFLWVFCAFAGSLRAPTAASPQWYLSLFAVVNAVAGNLSRMSPPKVEDSPNFQAAVKKLNGGSNANS
jgi:hypothetical protein